MAEMQNDFKRQCALCADSAKREEEVSQFLCNLIQYTGDWYLLYLILGKYFIINFKN